MNLDEKALKLLLSDSPRWLAEAKSDRDLSIASLNDHNLFLFLVGFCTGQQNI